MNRLARATSPYLLQHAHNPVDWHEWGEEAFTKAAREDKPIFLSIGYAACHWCHVMEHESFESQEVAGVLNDHFVSIKVDREERPDVDEVYMAYTQARTGSGGWPMSVWLTPEGNPFHAATYLPREHLLGTLKAVIEAWSGDRQRIVDAAGASLDFVTRWARVSAPPEGVIPLSVVDDAAVSLALRFDPLHGGVSSGGNKFPPCAAMELLLRVYRRTGQAELLDAVRLTLERIAHGGIYDQIGGGICRYSTDREWLVPHFEKMLYDQALVSSIFLDAFQLTREPLYARVAADILDYVLADLQSPEGGFYSSRDADTGGLEGAYYIWNVEQVLEILGEQEGGLCCAYYDVSAAGNWFDRLGHAPPGPKNILHVPKGPDVFARLHGLGIDDLRRRVGSWREKLRAARCRRVAPALDDKILTSWNGLMIASLAKAARVLDQPKYAAAARRAGDFILRRLRVGGRLLCAYRGGQAHLTGYLTDYAFLVEGFLNLYEATFEPAWLDHAVALTETAIEYYYDDQGGAFFFTAHDGERLIARSKQQYDGAVPSGNSVQALNLLRLAVLFERDDFRAKAEAVLRVFALQAEEFPQAFERLLCTADFHHDRTLEIAIVGEEGAPETESLLRAVYERYLPNKVVAGIADARPGAFLPLLREKPRIGGRSTAYVCRARSCRLPATSADELGRQLDTG